MTLSRTCYLKGVFTNGGVERWNGGHSPLPKIQNSQCTPLTTQRASNPLVVVQPVCPPTQKKDKMSSQVPSWDDYLDARTRLITAIANHSFTPPFPKSGTVLVEDVKHAVGLENRGSTCFLNVLLQVLGRRPEFQSELFSIADNDDKVIKALQTLFHRLLTTKKSSIATTDLTQAFGWDMSHLHTQQDIHELLVLLLDSIKGGDEVERLFRLEVVNKIVGVEETCAASGHSSSREESMIDLCLHVSEDDTSKNTVDAAMAEYFHKEKLEGDCKWQCDDCGGKVDAMKFVEVKSWPTLLFMVIQRNAFCMKTFRQKKVTEEFQIAMSCRDDYELNSVLIHRGTATGGHYYCITKDEEAAVDGSTRWLVCNDSCVTVLNEAEFRDRVEAEDVRRGVYMLLYNKVRGEPGSSSSSALPIAVPEDIKQRVGEEEKEWEMMCALHEIHKTVIEVTVVGGVAVTGDNEDVVVYARESESYADFVERVVGTRKNVRLSRFSLVTKNVIETFTNRPEASSLMDLGWGKSIFVKCERRAEGQEWDEVFKDDIHLKIFFCPCDDEGFEAFNKLRQQASFYRGNSFCGDDTALCQDVVQLTMRAHCKVAALKQSTGEGVEIYRFSPRTNQLESIGGGIWDDEKEIKACGIVSGEVLLGFKRGDGQEEFNVVEAHDHFVNQVVISFGQDQEQEEVQISKNQTIADLQRLIQEKLKIVDPDSFHLKTTHGKALKECAVIKLTNLASGGEVIIGEGRGLKADETRITFVSKTFDRESEKYVFEEVAKLFCLHDELVGSIKSRLMGELGDVDNKDLIRLVDKNTHSVCRNDRKLKVSCPKLGDERTIIAKVLDNPEIIEKTDIIVNVKFLVDDAKVTGVGTFVVIAKAERYNFGSMIGQIETKFASVVFGEGGNHNLSIAKMASFGKKTLDCYKRLNYVNFAEERESEKQRFMNSLRSDCLVVVRNREAEESRMPTKAPLKSDKVDSSPWRGKPFGNIKKKPTPLQIGIQ